MISYITYEEVLLKSGGFRIVSYCCLNWLIEGVTGRFQISRELKLPENGNLASLSKNILKN